MSPEMQAKIQIWRQKHREGTLSPEEYREALKAIREDRVGAAATSAASRGRKTASRAKANVNSDDLLSELDGL